MSVSIFLANVEAIIQNGNATEHTYRPALKTLLESLLTGYTAINEPKQAEYGAPDFVIQQHTTPIGHVEAKSIGVELPTIIADSGRDMPKTTNGKQLKRYRAALPNLLYTDGLVWYWFVAGEVRTEVPICIATWDKRTHKLHRSNTAETDLTTLIEQFAQYVGGIVGTPKDLAHRLAQIARWLDEEIGKILQQEEQQGSLHQQLNAFRQTLLPNLAPTEFADMYAQTLVYGLFAARVALSESPIFTRYDAAHAIPKTNPFLRKMFQQIAGFDLDERIAWLVDDCVRLLERTDMAEVLRDFGKVTKQEDPVVHFYETFLAAYDPKTREMRGVYYTPEPVVSYIVRSVDHLLQTCFGKPMGLAEDDTLILDPATGTATFLHTVVQHIYATLQDWGIADTWNQYVPEKLLPRLFGFELLMAPYTIAHLKLSMLLQQLGYTFGSNERLCIYLTNALSTAPTGQYALPFVQFIAEEGKAADEIKHSKPVMVILGNPPYSGHSANKAQWIDDLLHGKLPDGASTENYYEVDGEPLGERNSKWLQDDYVKFMRFGQWRISQTAEGILAFISNNGYLDNPTFRGMRESLLHEFDTIYILNLHGSSKKKERAPDGSPDENVFDIQQGVAIGILVKTSSSREHATVYYADVWGSRDGKYAYLWDWDVTTTDWQQIHPDPLWYMFIPKNTHLCQEYQQGWDIPKSMPRTLLGPNSHRDHFAIAFDYATARSRIRDLANTRLDDQTIREKYTIADTRDWSLQKARKQVTDDIAPVQCIYRPFDIRYMLYGDFAFDYHRPDVNNQLLLPNLALITTRQTKEPFSLFVCDKPAGQHKLATPYDGSYLSPLYLYPNGKVPEMLFEHENGRRPNFSAPFIAYVEHRLGLTFIPDGSGDLMSTVGPEDVFHYLYAVLHSPTYRSRYAELLKIDFPRIPITSDTSLFKTLVGYGAALVDLHLLRTPSKERRVGGAGGASILAKPGEQGVTQHQATNGAIGKITYDETQQRVMLDTNSYFAGVEPSVWTMQIGGYQPLQKWLKDRKGRTLSFDEVVHYMRMVVALRETQHLMLAIDAAIPGLPLR